MTNTKYMLFLLFLIQVFPHSAFSREAQDVYDLIGVRCDLVPSSAPRDEGIPLEKVIDTLGTPTKKESFEWADINLHEFRISLKNKIGPGKITLKHPIVKEYSWKYGECYLTYWFIKHPQWVLVDSFMWREDFQF